MTVREMFTMVECAAHYPGHSPSYLVIDTWNRAIEAMITHRTTGWVICGADPRGGYWEPLPSATRYPTAEAAFEGFYGEAEIDASTP